MEGKDFKYLTRFVEINGNSKINALKVLYKRETEGFLSRTRQSILIASCNVTGAIAY